MSVKQFREYVFGLILLVAVLAGAATLPLFVRGESVSNPSYTHSIDKLPQDYTEMSRRERVDLVGFHRSYVATESDIPSWMEVSLISQGDVEAERREALAAEYEEIMELFHMDRQSHSAQVNSRNFDWRGTLESGKPMVIYPESEEVFLSVDHGDNYYAFTNAEGVTMRVWHIYGRLTLEWSTWVNMYIDIDTAEVYYFYISSKYIGNAENYKSGNLINESVREIQNLWGRVIGFPNHETLSGANNERPVVFTNETGAVQYDVSWSVDHVSEAYDLRLLMIHG